MAWFDRMPKVVQAWLAIGGVLCGLVGAAFAAGAATSATARDLRTIPARVDAVEHRVDTLWATSGYLMRVDSQRVGVWGNVATMAREVSETRCYVRAMALKQDPLVKCSALLQEPVHD